MRHNCPECGSTMTYDANDQEFGGPVFVCDDWQCAYIMAGDDE